MTPDGACPSWQSLDESWTSYSVVGDRVVPTSHAHPRVANLVPRGCAAGGKVSVRVWHVLRWCTFHTSVCTRPLPSTGVWGSAMGEKERGGPRPSQPRDALMTGSGRDRRSTEAPGPTSRDAGSQSAARAPLSEVNHELHRQCSLALSRRWGSVRPSLAQRLMATRILPSTLRHGRLDSPRLPYGT